MLTMENTAIPPNFLECKFCESPETLQKLCLLNVHTRKLGGITAFYALVLFYAETSLLICWGNQMIGFYMKCKLGSGLK